MPDDERPGPVPADEPVDADTRSQIVERLRWSPAELLAHLRQQLAFEDRAKRARRLG